MGITFTIHKTIAPRWSTRTTSNTNQRDTPTGHRSDSKSVVHNTPQCFIPEVFNEFPTSSECKIHLKLLKVFANLKEDVSSSNGLHGWELYVTRSAERFEKWWTSIAPKDKSGRFEHPKESTWNTPGMLESMLCNTKAMKWTKANLPPIDVLMVLHGFMLNPRNFLEDCLRHNLISLWKAGMPWDLLDYCIDESTYSYSTPKAAIRSWRTTTGCEWVNADDKARKMATCPVCGSSCAFGLDVVSLGSSSSSNRQAAPCNIKCKVCHTVISKDLLCFWKLKSNIEDLRQRDSRLPGTMLSLNGQAVSHDPTNAATTALTDSNALISSEAYKDIMSIADDTASIREGRWCLKAVEETIRSSLPATATRNQRVLLDRFLATVTQPTIFSLSLADAVIRQCAFIETMQTVSWLFSPGLDLTLSKLLSNYQHFFTIMAKNPGRVAVPTYAVDLAWHTHQLSPQSYYDYSITRTNGTFINHDDKLGESTLSNGFDFTKDEFSKLTGREYGECLCWHCMTLEVVKASALPTDPQAAEGMTLDRIARAQYKKLEVDFTIAMDRAQRLKQVTPSQEAFLKRYVWLYPKAMPVLNANKQ